MITDDLHQLDENVIDTRIVVDDALAEVNRNLDTLEAAVVDWDTAMTRYLEALARAIEQLSPKPADESTDVDD